MEIRLSAINQTQYFTIHMVILGVVCARGVAIRWSFYCFVSYVQGICQVDALETKLFLFFLYNIWNSFEPHQLLFYFIAFSVRWNDFVSQLAVK